MASLHYYYSTMNAGKSLDLLRSNYNYQERGMKTYILKPQIDTREEKEVIRSRTGLEAECELFGQDADLFSMISEYTLLNGDIKCVFIDEAQFMTEAQVIQLALVVHKLGIPVVTYGLRSDFQGKLFPGSAALLVWANKLTELKTICWCGSKATMVLRLDTAGKVVRIGEQVQIGGNDSYVSVCSRHFLDGQIADTVY